MTILVLKSVYFEPMEIKTLFYVAIGIIWLLSKFLEANKKSRETNKRVEGPVIVVPQENQRPVQRPVVNLPRQKQVRQPKMTRNMPQSIKKGEEEGKVVNYENYFSKRKPLFTEETVMQELQILEHNEDHPNSIGSDISKEIRSGTFNWKRAVVINELLKHQHFR